MKHNGKSERIELRRSQISFFDVTTRMAPIRITSPPSSCRGVIFCESSNAEKTTAVTGSAVHKTEAMVDPTRFIPAIKVNSAILHEITAEAIAANQAAEDI